MRVLRVLRGGSYGTWDLRTTNRYWDYPGRRYGDIGFRIVVIRRKVP